VYSCTAPGIDAIDIPTTLVPPALPSNLPAGLSVPAGLVGFKVSFALPKKAAKLMDLLGVTGGNSPDFGMLLGTSLVPANALTVDEMVPQDDGSLVMNATGRNGAFTTPAPGVYDITMPTAFTLVATGASGEVGSIACSTESPALLSSITVVKQTSLINASSKRVKKGQKATVPVKVTNMSGAATGSVTASLDGRSLGRKTLAAGAAKFVTAKLGKVGKHKMVLSYGGDALSEGSRKTVFITVTK
jgi:hypothetical protein